MKKRCLNVSKTESCFKGGLQCYASTSGWGGEVGDGEGNWTSSTSVCSRSTVQSPAVSLPVTVVMWLEESEVLLWKRLVPVQ